MLLTRKRIAALIFVLVGIFVWFDQYRQGYSFSLSDLLDNRVHHEKIMAAAFILAIIFLFWDTISERRSPPKIANI